MKKLFVFDLDFTLWDAGGTWCDCTIPPYRKKGNEIYDAEGSHIKLYPDVIHILETLRKSGKKIAVASRTSAPKSARQLMKLLKFDHMIDYSEIYPRQKTFHFNELSKQSGLDYNDMVFFDDEMRNIRDLQDAGVESIHVSDGICKDLVFRYLAD